VKKIILDLCGGSGSWSKPYKEAGYDVHLITLPDHDVRTYVPPKNVYGILAAPPCTKFSMANWKVKKADRNFKEGMECVRACMKIIWDVQENGAPLAFWALENPQGYLYNFLGAPAFHFQPWQFGETGILATKRNAIWGYFNTPLRTVSERSFPYRDQGSRRKGWIEPNRLFPLQNPKNNKWSGLSAAKRAITSEGFACAFLKANQ
jgi:hypothetical protein